MTLPLQFSRSPRRKRQFENTDMKIIVIGKSARIRREIAKKLRDEGHEAELSSSLPVGTRSGAAAAAPDDPGQAGRHLRQFLECTSDWLVGLSRAGRTRVRQGQWPLGRLKDGSL